MTELLEKAIKQLKGLEEEKQNAIALLIIEELEDEVEWDISFSKSQGLLADMAEEAMAEHRAGQTRDLNPETL